MENIDTKSNWRVKSSSILDGLRGKIVSEVKQEKCQYKVNMENDFERLIIKFTDESQLVAYSWDAETYESGIIVEY